MGEDHVLVVEGLNVTRGGAQVIRDASFVVNRNDYVGIVGPNGGGKTTLLLAILGMIPRESGTIKIFNQDIASFRQWQRLAYVPQDAVNFDPNFPITVRELISLGRVNRGNLGRPLKGDDWEAVEDSIDFMGLREISDRRMGELSGGQKQRAFIAKALVRGPEILFLDEPIVGVDADTQEKFFQKMSNLNQKRNITILMVSHDLTAVFCRMSRVLCVNRDVYSSPITPTVDPNELLRKAYGEHFHFVYHRHECRGDFKDE